MRIEAQAVVIGGGLTGAGILRDLAERGVSAVLVERRDIDAGASGANHGLLHSGGRYIVKDPLSAGECVQENRILKRVAAGCIEDTGGFFVALEEDEDTYIDAFLRGAEEVGLPVEEVSWPAAREEEPYLVERCKAIYRVPDASINPFLATRANLAAARARGAQVLLHTQVIALKREGGRLTGVTAINGRTGQEVEIQAEQVISAAGPWVAEIGALAGINIPIAYSKGSLLITNSRLVNHVINRLRSPSDGDIIVPGESVTITGTTSIRVSNLDHLTTSSAEVDHLINEAARVLPVMEGARYIRLYAGVRPLVLAEGTAGDRSLSRSFTIFDHERDGLRNLVTIAGGKLTTYRLMAEKVTDLVCQRLGVSEPCLTATLPLPGSETGRHMATMDRLARLRRESLRSEILCECEMVGREQVEEIIDLLLREGHPVDPNALRLRSRLGMGTCQGGFCGFRTIGFLYEQGLIGGTRGNEMLTDFLEKRWNGIRPVLWGEQLKQEQLLEAIYCGTLNIDGSL